MLFWHRRKGYQVFKLVEYWYGSIACITISNIVLASAIIWMTFIVENWRCIYIGRYVGHSDENDIILTWKSFDVLICFRIALWWLMNDDALNWSSIWFLLWSNNLFLHQHFFCNILMCWFSMRIHSLHPILFDQSGFEKCILNDFLAFVFLATTTKTKINVFKIVVKEHNIWWFIKIN